MITDSIRILLLVLIGCSFGLMAYGMSAGWSTAVVVGWFIAGLFLFAGYALSLPLPDDDDDDDDEHSGNSV